MRYQWWRDGVSAAFKGAPPRSPVFIALHDVLQRMGGSKQDGGQGQPAQAPTIKQYHLKRMLDTREADALDPQPPLSLEGLERYAEGTASQVGGFSGGQAAPHCADARPVCTAAGHQDVPLPLMLFRSCSTFSWAPWRRAAGTPTTPPPTWARLSAWPRC